MFALRRRRLGVCALLRQTTSPSISAQIRLLVWPVLLVGLRFPASRFPERRGSGSRGSEGPGLRGLRCPRISWERPSGALKAPDLGLELSVRARVAIAASIGRAESQEGCRFEEALTVWRAGVRLDRTTSQLRMFTPERPARSTERENDPVKPVDLRASNLRSSSLAGGGHALSSGGPSTEPEAISRHLHDVGSIGPPQPLLALQSRVSPRATGTDHVARAHCRASPTSRDGTGRRGLRASWLA